MHRPHVVIRGAGVIGRALALELHRRGRNVLLLGREHPGTASLAAAGMLAAHDPHNPPALQPLADLALALYPEFLARIRDLSGHLIPIHTQHVLEPHPQGTPGHTLLPAISPEAGNFILREEQSLDPRELMAALTAACAAAGIPEQTVPDASETAPQTGSLYVDCTGAWSPHTRPAKGQMLRVRLPLDTLLLPHGGNTVLRTADIYLVPRLDGTTLIGATVEDAGFDLNIDRAALADLRAKAAALVSAVANAPEVESWSGLRPRTPDDLPVLGTVGHGCFIANGLFRNGILLAPAVAHVMARLLCGEQPEVDLEPFSPYRPALR